MTRARATFAFTFHGPTKAATGRQSVNPLTPNGPYRGRTAPQTSKFTFYIYIQQTEVLDILNMVYTLPGFSSSKCSLFHNSNVFGSCIIHILYTGVIKFKKLFRPQKDKEDSAASNCRLYWWHPNLVGGTDAQCQTAHLPYWYMNPQTGQRSPDTL